MKLLSFEGVGFKRPYVFRLFGVFQIIGLLMLMLAAGMVTAAFLNNFLPFESSALLAIAGVFVGVFSVAYFLKVEPFDRHGPDLAYAFKRLEDVERFYGIAFPDWDDIDREDRRKYTSPAEAFAGAMRGETSTTLFSYADKTINPDASGLHEGVVRQIRGQWVVLELTPGGKREALKPATV